MCNDSFLLQLFYYIDKLIDLAKFLLPLIIIVTFTMDLSKSAIQEKPDEFGKHVKKAVSVFIATFMIFFAPAIIETIFNIVSKEYSVNNPSCLLEVTKDDIQDAFLAEADEVITTMENSKSNDKVNIAKRIIAQIDDEAKSNALTTRLKNIKYGDDSINDATVNEDENNEENNSGGKEEPASPEKTKKDKKKDKDKKEDLSNKSGTKSPTKLVYYAQCSTNYKSISYSDGTYNACGCGCGYFSLSMVIDGLKGTSYTPIKIVNTFSPSKYASGKCAILDTTLYDDKIKKKYGINKNILFGRNNKPSAEDIKKRKDLIVKSLNKGHVIVLLIPGHYIALGGINNGKISVYDPGSSSRNGEYTIDELYNTYKNFKNRCNDVGKCGFIYAVEYWV